MDTHPSESGSTEMVEIRNQAVRDPTPEEILQRSAEVRKTWNSTRWKKETRRFRSRVWTVPEVSVAGSLSESTSA